MSYQVFDSHASEYDAWYDTEVGKAIFAMEVECLKPLLHRYSRPYLEVGVGSGRFAQALGIEYEVDPAPALVQMAKARGIKITKAQVRNCPFLTGCSEGLLWPSLYASWIIRKKPFRKRGEFSSLKVDWCLV